MPEDIRPEGLPAAPDPSDCGAECDRKDHCATRQTKKRAPFPVPSSITGGVDGTRTRDLRRDRPAFYPTELPLRFLKPVRLPRLVGADGLQRPEERRGGKESGGPVG